jgi:hypothetical protein
VWEYLKERFLSLRLHNDYDAIVDVACKAWNRILAENRARCGLGKPETFNFLGLTHICGRSRCGRLLLLRHTRAGRIRAELKEVKDGLKRHIHQPIPAWERWLGQVVGGFFGYHAVPTNRWALSAFRYHVTWRRTLRRRSQKDAFTWARSLTTCQRLLTCSFCALTQTGLHLENARVAFPVALRGAHPVDIGDAQVMPKRRRPLCCLLPKGHGIRRRGVYCGPHKRHLLQARLPGPDAPQAACCLFPHTTRGDGCRIQTLQEVSAS